MEMTGEHTIRASRELVWEALNDPEVLKASIAGCETLEKTSDTEFSAKVKAKVGPVSAKFAGDVTLSDLDPPNSYTISGEGRGGAAGFAKGGAKVRLEEGDAGSTRLLYEVDAKVGGKLAQIGARLINGAAKKMAEDFFTRFSELVEAKAPAPEPAAPAQEAAPAEEAAPAQPAAAHSTSHAAPAKSSEDLDKDVGAGANTGVWVTGVLVAVLVLIALFALS